MYVCELITLNYFYFVPKIKLYRKTQTKIKKEKRKIQPQQMLSKVHQSLRKSIYGINGISD